MQHHLSKRFFGRFFGSVILMACAMMGFNPAVAVAQSAVSTDKNTPNQWTLNDYFAHAWNNELVTYPVDGKTASNNNQSLVDADGKQHAYQWLTDEKQTRIAFMADVPADGSSTYRLIAGKPVTQTDLKIEQTADVIQIFNNHTGVAIRKTLSDKQAPIAAIRLKSGKWVGDSNRSENSELKSYTAKIVHNGPVMVEVHVDATFQDGKKWQLNFRLLANEPVVTVNESFDLGTETTWQLQLNKNFSPTRLFSRDLMERTTTTREIVKKDATICIVEPWVRWWMRTNSSRQSFYSDDNSDDMLTLGATDAALWVNMEHVRAKTPRSKPEIPIKYQDGGIFANFDLTLGERHWLIAAPSKSETLKLLAEEPVVKQALSIPHTYIIKYGDFPLDRVKDQILEWPSTATHPRMQLMPEDIERLKANLKVTPTQLDEARRKMTRLGTSSLIPIYLATGDEQIGRYIAEFGLKQLQHHVDHFLLQKTKGSINAWPHKQQGFGPMLNILDVGWNALTPEEVHRAKAQIAFIGYAVNSPDYWSLERNYRANPNMTTMVASYQAGCGYMLPDHPMSDEWIASGMAEAIRQITKWSDSEGGWLEAPHYAITSYDALLGMFLMARGKDNGKLLYSDQMKKVANFFAKIATPPDVKIQNMRHQPRVGNTWLDEPAGIYGYLAGIWKDKDPEFASNMQWMFLQHGSWPNSASGGRMPTFEGIGDAFRDPSVVPIKPDYKSTFFPKTGVSLRNAVDDRETQLYMIAGTNHEHYDDDSGSITIWGKGRIVANDFAYAEASRKYHNLVVGGGAGRLMYIGNFKTTPSFDTTHGVSGPEGKRGWQRQIIFVKDTDVLAPNYFIINDTLKAESNATWRLWLDGSINIADPTAHGKGVQLQAATLVGNDDVDTDFALVTKGGADLGTEHKSSTLFGLAANGKKHPKIEFSLDALTAKLTNGQSMLTVIYPRLKTQKAPKITPLADGRGVKVEHEAGTDYIFLSVESFQFNQDDIHFEGTNGLVKIRGSKAELFLGEKGTLKFRGQSISE